MCREGWPLFEQIPSRARRASATVVAKGMRVCAARVPGREGFWSDSRTASIGSYGGRSCRE